MDFTIRRAGHVVLRVTDLMRAKEFLEDVVGFQTYGQEGSFYFLTANPVSNHHMIAVRSGKSGERLPDPRQIGMISISYEVNTFDDLRRLYQRIKQQGPAFGATLLRTEDFGWITNFAAADHDGNGLEFYCRRLEGDGTDLDAPVDAEDPKRLPNRSSGIRRTSHLNLRCTDRAA
jgi:catechol-2,3-dioxygenase